jgi:hypothetical protein
MGKHLYFSILLIALYSAACTGHAQHGPVIKDNKIVSPPVTSIPEDPENKLIGTTVLKSSERNLHAGYIHGLWLDSTWLSPCTETGEEPPPSEIVSIQQPYDSVLIVDVKVNGNCGSSFLGEIDMADSSTINLVSTSYGSHATCVCCYGLTYRITLSDQGEYPFDKLKYVALNGQVKKSLPELRVPVSKLK